MLLRLVGIIRLLGLCIAIGFTGRIEGIPSHINEVHHAKNAKVLNGHNYQSRFSIELVPLNCYKSEVGKYFSGKFSHKKGVLNKDYEFKFNDLHAGEYVLLINSHDFVLSSNRLRIIANSNDDIKAYQDNIGRESYNVSSGVSLNENALVINFVDVKQYYEETQGSLLSILEESPFGFIFKNKIYTILFAFCIVMIVTPYVVQWINPEFAETLQEIQENRGTRDKVEYNPEEVEANVSSFTIDQEKTSNKSARKRK